MCLCASVHVSVIPMLMDVLGVFMNSLTRGIGKKIATHNREQEIISDGLNIMMCRGLKKHTSEGFKAPLNSNFTQLNYTRRNVRKKREAVLK